MRGHGLWLSKLCLLIEAVNKLLSRRYALFAKCYDIDSTSAKVALKVLSNAKECVCRIVL